VYYIQQALNLINTLAANESAAEVNATIWLTKGDHFFFNCDEQVPTTMTNKTDADGTTTNELELTAVYSTASPRPPLQHNYLCAHKSMKFFYPKTDNVNLVIKTILCNDLASERAVAEPSTYQSKCATVATERDPWAAEQTDERPVVHVNGPNFYFNVTKSLVVENIIFDGIN
jgi:hypothetical protein